MAVQNNVKTYSPTFLSKNSSTVIVPKDKRTTNISAGKQTAKEAILAKKLRDNLLRRQQQTV